MKKLFKKQKEQLDFSSLNPILTSRAAVGVAIANHVGSKPQIGGTIGVGFALLVTGLIEATKDDTSKNKIKKF